MVALAASHAAGEFRLTATAPGQLSAQGPLTFATARGACELGLRTLREDNAASAQVDCRGITACDSAGLAVLLDWLGAAQSAGRKLRYSELPAGLQALAHISEVRELLERGV